MAQQTPERSQHLSALAWKTDAAEPQRFVAVHGRESAIFGYSDKCLEVWACPIQLLSDYQISFHEQGSVEPIAGRQILRRVQYFPDRVIRIDLFERERLVVTRSKFLLVEGPLQNQDV
ncbi:MULTISPECIES: hypothetical protein [Acidobacterium]|uniref:Uncharacterized protein n=1 Tax=Acidobacterium capsulatum (strain ATCC 51196 / DSM 11244 / BCRC 80197 / JCM 7670 / NBRC 15755 / NCIMB 13165 / 161) TaxID=240015 RepID=C1F6T9_ACIC5|nr:MULTISPECIES: hypothetical protein [Acidobacterium]ACO31332.1 hypothetical protein ACP_1597 [Acidobacterium capsulatum ATCC 51196]HCT60979.1 hypothetical protein [Acidobacterium sp.]